MLCKVSHLAKTYGSKVVLQDINFTLRQGEIFAIIGKSGSGKTTLLKSILGLVQCEGTIEKNYSKQDIGFSSQHNSFYPELSLIENALYFGRIYGLSKKEVIARLNHYMQLTDLETKDMKKKAGSLSGGMQKRFDIICALLHNPKLLVLDEPTAGLDPVRRKQLMFLVRKISALGITVIYTTHIMSDINTACDRVMLVDKGKTILVETPEHIRGELLEHEQIVIQSSPGNYEPIVKFLSSFNIISCKAEDNKLIIYTPETEIFLHYVLHVLEDFNESLEDITVSEADLEDLFQSFEEQNVTKVINKNIQQVRSFIEGLVGKKYSKESIKEILVTHKWPKEVVEVLVNKTP
jgi:ABC-2 type transport system ATP-binding protein